MSMYVLLCSGCAVRKVAVAEFPGGRVGLNICKLHVRLMKTST